MVVALAVLALGGAVTALAVLTWRQRGPAGRAGEPRSQLRAATAELKRVQLAFDRDVRVAEKSLATTTRARGKAISAAKKQLSSASDPRGRRLDSYKGVVLYERWITAPHGQGSVAGVHASVDAQVSNRITATRLVTIGIFALAARKKTGAVYLSIDGPDFADVIECPPEDNMKARTFAVAIQNAGLAAPRLDAAQPALILAAERALEDAESTKAVDEAHVIVEQAKTDKEHLKAIAEARAAVEAAELGLAPASASA